jgi:hypothetical protein
MLVQYHDVGSSSVKWRANRHAIFNVNFIVPMGSIVPKFTRKVYQLYIILKMVDQLVDHVNVLEQALSTGIIIEVIHGVTG